jgi:transcriptional regulator with XRE-family HTH domain
VSYTIPPDSPKAVKALTFGVELVKACKARSIPLKELERATGVGHTSLDNYRRGLILPKVEVARALAAALNWPKLAEMIAAARTVACARSGCRQTFRNDTGAPRKYCSEMCRRIAENLRDASHRRRQAGQTGSKLHANAAMRKLRSGLAIADERGMLLQSAIDAMCRGCEPDGICQVEECPLRPFSPLPLGQHALRSEPRTEFRIRSEARAQFRDSQREQMIAWHADPANAAKKATIAAAHRAHHAAMTPEQKAVWRGRIAATKAARRRQKAKAS